MNATNSKTYVINGVELELYTLGELARRVDRQTQTLRTWENLGIIPQAIYRSGSKRRLYSENQIQAIVDCVNKHNITQGQEIPKAFIADAAEAFRVASERDFE